MSGHLKVMAVFLAVLWLPVASHCDLEHLAGLEFLACCGEAGAAPHQNDDCQTDVCASVESGQCKTEERVIMAIAPSLEDVIPNLMATAEPGATPATVLAVSTVPPELPQLWQFTHRVALPARAPSSAS